MAAAARSGRFGEYNYRCACIAQLVEQLTLNQRNAADSNGRPRTAVQLNQISWQGLLHIYNDVSTAAGSPRRACAAFVASAENSNHCPSVSVAGQSWRVSRNTGNCRVVLAWASPREG
jgi:hypothetical protein